MSREQAVRSLRALDAMTRKSRENAAEWGDLDDCLRVGFEELAERATKLAAEIEEVFPGRPRRKKGKREASRQHLDQQELPLG